MLRITVSRAGLDDRHADFKGHGPIEVGRRPDADLHIQDGRISSQHGELSCRGGVWWYRDLRSTNGSLLLSGGQRTVVDGRTTVEVPLVDGDTLLLGDVDDPVVLAVQVRPDPEPRPETGTVVVRRAATETVDPMSVWSGTDVGSVFTLLRAVDSAEDAAAVFSEVAAWVLSHVPGTTQVVLVPKDDDVMVADQSAVRIVGPDEPAPYPRGVVADALRTGDSVLASLDHDLGTDESLVRLSAVSAAVVPIARGTARYGALVAVAGRLMASGELDMLTGLSTLVAHAFAHAAQLKRLRAVERRLRDENRYLRERQPRDGTFGDIIGQAPAMTALFEHMRVVMDTDATVLVTGETGTGKELVARALHDKSRRKDRLFAAVNCAALSEHLLESELFGHVKGAFTGATDRKQGLFAVADRGTLFLDELGEMSLRLQAKLLRVLQEGEVLPVGSTRPIKVDVRIVAATHRDLRAMARAGTFREDLFYRINVFPLRLPPLRERREDIVPLAELFIRRYAKQFGRDVDGLSHTAVDALLAHAFPGNIRELENEIQRAVLLTTSGRVVDVHALSAELRQGASGGSVDATSEALEITGSLKSTMERLEREVLRRALDQRGWNRSATARELGISRQALMVKLSRYELVPE